MSAPGHGAGQDDIFREVLKQQRVIRAVLYRCGVPAAYIDDLVQDALVIAYRKIQQGAFHPPDGKPLSNAVAAWLTGISRNLARDLRDSLALRASIFADAQHDSVDPDTIAVPSLEARWMAKTELAILGKVKLSAVRREIITLAGMGYTAVEIGAALGLVPDTVATHLRRVRAAFGKALQKRSK